MSNQLAGLTTVATATPLQLLEVALFLHEISIKNPAIKDPSKLYPQFNSEKSLFAYACQKLFNGKTGLNPDELQQAREFVKPLQAGFRALYAYLLQQDAMFKIQSESESFKSPNFFTKTNQVISSSEGNFAIAVKRMNVTNIKTGTPDLITSLVFIPEVNKPVAANLGTPQTTAPQPMSFINAQTPAQAIAQGNVPPVTNGVHAPASM